MIASRKFEKMKSSAKYMKVTVMTQEQRDEMTTEGNKRMIPFARNRTLHLLLTGQTYYP